MGLVFLSDSCLGTVSLNGIFASQKFSKNFKAKSDTTEADNYRGISCRRADCLVRITR